MRHTRPDPCRYYHGRPKCDPSTVFVCFRNHNNSGYTEGEYLFVLLYKIIIFTLLAVSQFPVKSRLSDRRVFKFFFFFFFSGVSYVLQKKMKSLFTLYRSFFRLWYEPKDLKWWHSFLCQGVYNLYISWYYRMILAGEVGLFLRGKCCFVFSEEDGVTSMCLRCVVSSLSVVSPLAKFVRNERRMKK